MNPPSTLRQRTTESSARCVPYHIPDITQPTGSSGTEHGTEQQVGKIKKPPGEMSRPRRGGYNLQVALAWSDEQWDEVKPFVKLTVVNKLDLEEANHQTKFS
ncbi:hypothetical protein BT96DRAFT_1002318 [Gymnopus androsaceus JB14]|uniref:Uncharacterized protein n=1 Tax=Gymnopus androsaceus JB14 TaxID=1447944 RepID=A0A6A4GY23_9AGAR|nr:hypothetical protein BT96DRAFT_1002318 [Gymnopus androsaceus JB14]